MAGEATFADGPAGGDDELWRVSCGGVKACEWRHEPRRSSRCGHDGVVASVAEHPAESYEMSGALGADQTARPRPSAVLTEVIWWFRLPSFRSVP